LPLARPWPPNSGESEERARLIDGKPMRQLWRIAVVAEGGGGNEAAKLLVQPGPPGRVMRVSDIGDRPCPDARRGWKSPPHGHQLTLAGRRQAYDGGELIAQDSGQGRLAVQVIFLYPEHAAHRFPRRRHRI